MGLRGCSVVSRKCGKLNEGLPPAGQSPSGALARNKHQILVHTLRTTSTDACVCRGWRPRKSVRVSKYCEMREASRNGTFKIKQYPNRKCLLPLLVLRVSPVTCRQRIAKSLRLASCCVRLPVSAKPHSLVVTKIGNDIEGWHRKGNCRR